MRLIDADRLLSDKMKSKYYHLPNGDVAIPIVDIEHAPTVGGWISVKDRLPEEEKDVLVARYWVDKKNKQRCYVEIAQRLGEDWLSDSDEYKIGRHYDPYAWMPLPEPPEGVKGL